MRDRGRQQRQKQGSGSMRKTQSVADLKRAEESMS